MRLGRWLSYRRSGKQKPGEARGLQLRRNRPENLRNLRNLRISCPVRARYAPSPASTCASSANGHFKALSTG